MGQCSLKAASADFGAYEQNELSCLAVTRLYMIVVCFFLLIMMLLKTVHMSVIYELSKAITQPDSTGTLFQWLGQNS